jgi:hypothetical protein
MKNRRFCLLLCMAALCAIPMSAQATKRSPKTVHFTEKSKIHEPAQAPPALATIFSNLGPATDTYNDTFAEIVAGPASSTGASFSFALPFSPKTNAHVREVRAALQWGGTGTNQVNLSLYSDVGGLPGTILAGPGTITNLPTWVTCCTLAVWKLTSDLPVTAGTRYWIVADTPTSGTGSDFFGVWNVIFPTPFLQASNVGGFQWSPIYGGEQDAAAAVYGTVP